MSETLGRTQLLVMQVLSLAHRPKGVRQIANDWPGLTESSVAGALARLADRGLVDRSSPHGFYVWSLTAMGGAVLREVERRRGYDDEDLDDTAAEFDESLDVPGDQDAS